MTLVTPERVDAVARPIVSTVERVERPREAASLGNV
jgi:hypothetical protein